MSDSQSLVAGSMAVGLQAPKSNAAFSSSSSHPAPDVQDPEINPQPPTPNAQLPVQKPRLLIVEDDESIRTQMKWALAADYEVFQAGDRASGLEVVKKEHPAVVTLDLGLPPSPGTTEEGFQALSEILEEDKLVKVVIITGQGEKDHALKAVGQGAYDFFCKPVQIDELKVVLRRAFHLSQIESEHSQLQQRLSAGSFEGMLGTSPKMQEVFSVIRKVATTQASILVIGESGTGKELVARAIHQMSSRSGGPFVAINCGAIPENLLESELFGHEKGSFTGAHMQRKGRVELAQKGTLFFDEIGELPLALQVKILRFLQEQVIERVGGREQIPVDARVIAATNRDLKQALRAGTFREDLYYRLAVVTVSLPLLSERGGDILFLANAFLRRYAEENKKKITGFTQQALNGLERYPWPGNVRELENRVKRAVIMSEGPKISLSDLGIAAHSKYDKLSLKEARDILERDLIQTALARNKGNISKAASELAVSRPTLYELMEKLGIGNGKKT